MPAAVIAENMFRGDCRLMRYQVVVEDPDLPPEQWQPVGDLTGWDFFATAKTYHDDLDAAALFQLTLGSGITVVDNVNSIIEITIPPAVTAMLLGSTNRFYMDVQAVDTLGAPWTLAAGRLIVKADVTRAVA